MKVIKAFLMYLIAFTSGIKNTAEAVNRAESVDELDMSIGEISRIKVR